MKSWLLLGAALLPLSAQAELYISIVQGLGGAPEYQQQFDEQREQIEAAANTIAGTDHVRVFDGEAATREALLAHFEQLGSAMGDEDRAAIYLIGHGSYDGFDYKFNLPGPDITGEDLKQTLAALPGRNHLLLNTSSTSGAMLELITGSPDSNETGGNILISATRNGNERNSTHFGRFFAEALSSEEADLNKNEMISVQEAFDYATRGVEGYFEEIGRLATEHAQLRGDGAGQFSLARLNEMPVAGEDMPELNELLEQRLALDAEIEELQLRRSEYSNAEYLSLLQELVLQSAELTERIDAMQQASPGASE